MSKKKRSRRKREKVQPTLPWEMPHPKLEEKSEKLSGKARDKKYPSTKWDPVDYDRLPGSFESGKRR
jgi:hypothetical protein